MKKKDLRNQINVLSARLNMLEKKLNELEAKNAVPHIAPTHPYIHTPYVVPVYEYNSCPAGGEHDYHSPWWGITSPPCKKCGIQAEMLKITWTTCDTGIES